MYAYKVSTTMGANVTISLFCSLLQSCSFVLYPSSRMWLINNQFECSWWCDLDLVCFNLTHKRHRCNALHTHVWWYKRSCIGLVPWFYVHRLYVCFPVAMSSSVLLAPPFSPLHHLCDTCPPPPLSHNHNHDLNYNLNTGYIRIDPPQHKGVHVVTCMCAHACVPVYA